MPPQLKTHGVWPDDDRDDFLDLLKGRCVEVLVGPKIIIGNEGQKSRTWCLSQDLLSYHSNLFKKLFEACPSKQSVIIDEEPDNFDAFVEFMLRGRYTYRDPLDCHIRVRYSARIWALGSYLEAPRFQNFAMMNLYGIYKPTRRAQPLSGIGPDSVKFVCEYFEPGEKLYEFVKDLVTTYWADTSVVPQGGEDASGSLSYDVWWVQMSYRQQWQILWKAFPEFRDSLLNGLGENRKHIKDLSSYLVSEAALDEKPERESSSSNEEAGWDDDQPDNPATCLRKWCSGCKTCSV